MLRRLVLSTVAAAVLAPATAGAATWSAPAPASQTPHTFVGPVDVQRAGDGALVAAWPWQDGVGDDTTRGASAAARPAGGAFGTEHPAGEGLLDVATYGQTRTLALIQDTGGLRVAFGRSDGSFAASRNLVRADLIYRPQLAVAPDGRALVAWIERITTRAGAQRRIVRAIERLPGQSFGAPFTLSGAGRADAVAVAVGAGGDEAVLLVRDGRVLARLRRSGHGWGSLLEAARATGATTWQVLAAAGPDGEVRFVWRRHQKTADGVPGRRALEGAVAAPGAFRLGAAQVIEADGVTSPVLTPGPDAWAVAYIHVTPDGPRPAARVAPRGGGFGELRYAGPAQGGVRGVAAAFAPSAGLTVAWIQPVAGQDSDGLAGAAVLGADGFGPVEDVTPAEAVHEVHLVGDGGAGQPVAVWTARPEGTGPSVPLPRLRSVVRSAARTP